MFKVLFFAILILPHLINAEPRLRPDDWGKPLIGSKLTNLYKVDKELYRSEQPEHENVINLKSIGIKEVLNLREFHSDEDDLKEGRFGLHRIKMNAGEVTEEQLVESLRIIMNRKGPVIVHCWHGSDRTGVVIAAYRIIFNNWSKAKAIDEMVNGGFGHHSGVYPNLVPLIENLNVERIKKSLGLTVGITKTESSYNELIFVS